MAFRGTIENGRLVLDDGANLPDGTRVDVSVRASKKRKTSKQSASPDSLGRLGLRAVKTGLSDLADRHDEHAYPGLTKNPARAGRGPR